MRQKRSGNDQQHREGNRSESAAVGASPFRGTPPAAAKKGSQQPPESITGGKLPVGLDWLSFTLPLACLSGWLAAVQSVLGVPEDQVSGRFSYQHSARFSVGGLVAWSPGRPEAFVGLDASSVSLFPSPLELMKLAAKHGAKFTRIDLRLDDYTRSLLDLDQVESAVAAGNVQHFRRVNVCKPLADVVTGQLEGRAVYFGRRGGNGSGRYVRFYDKGLESKGEMDCVRLEVEFSDEPAVQAGVVLCDSGTDERWAQRAAELVVGSIDFRDRTGAHGHVERMPRLAWWSRVVDAVGRGVLLRAARVKVRLADALAYYTGALPRRVAQACELIERSGHDAVSMLSAWLQQLRADGQAKIAGWIPSPADLGLSPDVLLSLRIGGAS